MVLGKLLAPGRPTTLDNSRARAYCAYSMGVGVVLTFFSRLSSLFFLPLSGRRSDIDKYSLRRTLSPKQPLNQLFGRRPDIDDPI